MPKPSSEYTHEQHIVSSTWSMYGPENFVTKLGRGWTVTVRETEIPVIFKTKREAVAAADRLCMAYLER